jgi:hypothetical protein
MCSFEVQLCDRKIAQEISVWEVKKSNIEALFLEMSCPGFTIKTHTNFGAFARDRAKYLALFSSSRTFFGY